MTDYVLSGLVKRRAELAGEADALRARLADITADLGHLDAVIRLFDPDHDIAAIRPKTPRGPDTAGRGERGRLVLDVLREAGEPIPAVDVVRRMLAKQGQDAGDGRLAEGRAEARGRDLRRVGPAHDRDGPGRNQGVCGEQTQPGGLRGDVLLGSHEGHRA